MGFSIGSLERVVTMILKIMANILLIILAFPLNAYAVGFPSAFSKISGVAIWIPYSEGGKSFPGESSENSSNEFIKYCDGINKIFILGIDNKSFKCKSEKLDSEGHYFRIYILDRDKRLYNKVTVSKMRLPQDNYSVEDITTEEFESIKPLLSERRRQLKKANLHQIKSYWEVNTHKSLAKVYDEEIKSLKSQPVYKKHVNFTKKIASSKTEVVIAPVGIVLGGLGWNFKYAAIKKENNDYVFIGELEGCIDGVADINHDGMPEISTTECENNEGTSDKYFSIHPSVKALIDRSQ